MTYKFQITNKGLQMQKHLRLAKRNAISIYEKRRKGLGAVAIIACA